MKKTEEKIIAICAFNICPHGQGHFMEDDGMHGSNLVGYDGNMCTPKNRCCDKEVVLLKIGKQRTWRVRNKKNK